VIAANVVVSLLGFRALRDDGAGRAEDFLFIPHQVADGRNGLGLLLSHFSHADLLHLGLNMWALYSFAPPVIDVVGAGWLIVIYIVAGLGADLMIFAIRHQEPLYRCLGASGSVFGVMTAAVVIEPTISIVLFFVPVPISGPVFMLGYAVFSLFAISRAKRLGVSHEGHLGGAVLGLALTGLVAPGGLQPLFRWFSQWL
jgi:membrane associated rhomboid family serine protease